MIEIDEDGHPYYENNEIIQNLIENLGFTFIRNSSDTDPDAGFHPDVEIAKIYKYVNKLSLKLAVNSRKKSVKGKFTKELLSSMSSFSEPLNYIMYFVEKNTTYLIKINSKTTKKHGRNKKYLRQDKIIV